MKLNYRRTFFIGLAFMSICSFWQVYDNIIPLMLKNTFGMGESLTGVIMALDNILAIFLLPLFGALSDKVSTPIGKRMPFILSGTVLSAVFIILMTTADNMSSLVFFIIALMFVLIFMGTYRSPAVALMPDLTPKPLRSKANSIINFMGAVGGVYALLMIKFLVPDSDKPNYLSLFISIVLFMIITVAVLFFTINEKKLSLKETETADETDKRDKKSSSAQAQSGQLPPDVKKSLIFLLLSVFFWFTAYNAVTTAFSRYAGEVWDVKGGGFADCILVGTVAAIISYIPIGIISSKFGRKKVILTGIIMMAVSYAWGFTFVNYSFALNIIFAIVGIGWAAINVNSYPMVVEMGSRGEVGKYTGIYYTFSMAAQIFTPVFSGFLLEHVSYRTLFPYAAIFSVLAFITMMMVRHGDAQIIKNEDVYES